VGILYISRIKVNVCSKNPLLLYNVYPIFPVLLIIFSKKGKNMIEWNAENTFYYAAIVSSIFLIVLYFLFRKMK